MKTQPCLLIRILICLRHPWRWRRRVAHGKAMGVLLDRMQAHPWNDADNRGNKLAVAYLILEAENARMWDEAFGIAEPDPEIQVIPYDRRLRDFLVVSG